MHMQTQQDLIGVPVTCPYMAIQILDYELCLLQG